MHTTGSVRREAAERRRDTLERLAAERDVWVSTAHPEHGPHQVPLARHPHRANPGSLWGAAKTLKPSK